MDGLRWLLLLFGVLLVAGIYFHSRREKKSPDEVAETSLRVEPSLLESTDQVSADPDAVEAVANIDSDNDVEQSAPHKIVTIRIVAREEKAFAGDELILSLRGIGLRHGKFGIFHRYDGNDESRTVFSAASLVEPGSFDLQNIKGQEIPGISFFLVLPGPVDSVEAFDSMLASARTLTQSLNGELLDESGSTLSVQRERYLREDIIQFQHSSLVS